MHAGLFVSHWFGSRMETLYSEPFEIGTELGLQVPINTQSPRTLHSFYWEYVFINIADLSDLRSVI